MRQDRTYHEGDTYDNAPCREVFNSLRECITNTDGVVIDRARTGSEDRRRDDVNHEVAEYLGTRNGHLPLLALEDLQHQEYESGFLHQEA